MPDEDRRITDDPAAKASNRRKDGMFCAAYIATVGFAYIVVYVPEIGQYAQGVITMVLAMFLNELKNMYQYENGTTRSSVAKDAAITNLAKTAAVTATTAQAAQAASEPAAQPQEQKP